MKNIITGEDVSGMYLVNKELQAYIEALENYYIEHQFSETFNLTNVSKELASTVEEDTYKINYRITPAERENVRKYRAMGVSIKDLAKEYNCSHTTISKIVKDMDVDLRKKDYTRAFFSKQKSD